MKAWREARIVALKSKTNKGKIVDVEVRVGLFSEQDEDGLILKASKSFCRQETRISSL